jgi:hypothetical protein
MVESSIHCPPSPPLSPTFTTRLSIQGISNNPGIVMYWQDIVPAPSRLLTVHASGLMPCVTCGKTGMRAPSHFPHLPHLPHHTLQTWGPEIADRRLSLFYIHGLHTTRLSSNISSMESLLAIEINTRRHEAFRSPTLLKTVSLYISFAV